MLTHAISVIHPTAIAVSQRTGNVFVASSSNNQVLVFNGRRSITADTLIHTNAARWPYAIVASEKSERVFISNYADASISMLDAVNGEVLRTTVVDEWPQGLVVLEQAARILVLYEDNSIVSLLDSESGSLLTTIALSEHLVAAVASERSNRIFVVGDEINEVTDAHTRVHVLEAHTGNLLYSISLDLYSPVTAAVEEEQGRVFVVTSGGLLGDIAVLDAQTNVASQALLHTITVGEGAGAIVVNGKARRGFVALNNISTSVEGRIAIIDTASGTVLRSTPISSKPNALALDRTSGRIFIADGSRNQRGRVTMLDPIDGTIARQVVTGEWPVAMAIDQVTGRVFVANHDDNSVSAFNGRM